MDISILKRWITKPLTLKVMAILQGILFIILLVISPSYIHAAKAKKADKKTTPEITKTVDIPSGLILHTSVTIGYDAPWRKVHELLISVALNTKHILKNPPPFVLQTSLDDFYVSCEINAYTDTPAKMAVIYSELHQNIQDSFNAGGVEIMSPHYSSLRDYNQTTIPEENLPETYAPLALRISRVDRGDSTADKKIVVKGNIIPASP
jgi:hypothetical protein